MEGNESKIRKVLFNEISLLISIIAFVIGCVLFITKPNAQMGQDIALIQQRMEIIQNNQTNHLTTVQKDIEAQEKEIKEIRIMLERILTLLGE